LSRFLILIEKANGNFSAYCPDILGCISTGDTIEETKENMREAIKLHLASLLEDGVPVPKQETVVDYMEIPDEEIVSESDEIRDYTYKKYIAPAKKQGIDKVKIRVREVHKALGYRNSLPLVYEAIGSDTFQKTYAICLTEKEGDPTLQGSRLIDFRYRQ